MYFNITPIAHRNISCRSVCFNNKELFHNDIFKIARERIYKLLEKKGNGNSSKVVI